MASKDIDKRKRIYTAILYICGFLLFLEWLRPLEQITDTGNIAMFIVYTAFCFLLSYLQWPWYMATPLKLAGMAFILDSMFMPQRFFSPAWFQYLWEHVQYNAEVMLSYQFWEMTPLFRSFLFLLLLWLMSYLVYYWFVVAKRISFFVILTFVYLTVLDTFTAFDGKIPIVRAFLVSLLVMGLSSMMKELERESISLKGKRLYRAWLLPLIVLVFSSTVIGYTAPKRTPQWPDPVPFIQKAASNMGGSGNTVQKVGYGTDDTQLGGSFVQDNTPVFQAAAKNEHYWRIETKDTYTGKGWVNSDEGTFEEYDPNSTLPIQTYEEENVETTEQDATISMEDGASFSRLVYPYDVQKVKQSGADAFQVNTTTDVIQPEKNGEQLQLEGYKVEYVQPSFSYQQLREASEEDPDDIEERYTQLPDSLPGRVKTLSENLVKDEENRYDKARAIEEHFTNTGFEYDTEGIPVPGENEDYVDQFLFDSRVGYCDNFSSSMVVMLRSVGIPARWAKGFTGGEEIDTATKEDGEEYTVYEVTSSNAHSWVEVYFPDIGWVPFEPTKGFGNHTDFYLEEETEEEEDSEVSEDLEESLNQEGPDKEELTEDQMEDGTSDEAIGSTSILKSVWFWVMAGGLVLTSFLLYRYRFHWLFYFYKKRFYRNPNKDNYEAAYHFLMKALAAKAGMARGEGQTLREYAREVDQNFQSRDMGMLTHYYERLLYRGDEANQPWQKVTELWENLIKKALS
ncbi:DUF3488 and DUF4129 domain-containing transglutaminase family protein [Pontibacillus salicampi]|uniref:DUF3488 and DUF4129 domain-containing transglutaminase family protein n=1 Tax=Pontibacillus salicampi TaxID=1449801 RepID=A0ABV6LTU1_9BACI